MRPATPTERLYAKRQCIPIMERCGSPGILVAELDDSGTAFCSHWDIWDPAWKTPEFSVELDAMIEMLRSDQRYGPVLKNIPAMIAYCLNNQESRIMQSPEYLFRVDAGYLIRLHPYKGEENLFLYCYRRDWLDRHMEQAEKGIRFIGPHYKELFRIPDGGQVRILREGCAPIDRTCRYIDDCHVEVGNGWDSLFHICQFAEQMERCHNEVIPLTPPLPEKCFTVQPSSGELIAIERYKPGYQVSPMAHFKGKTSQQTADVLNGDMGVTRAQAAAMLAGATLGWTSSAADPSRYNKRGRPIQSHRQDRGEAR